MKQPFYEYHRDKDEKMMISCGNAGVVSNHFHRNIEIHYILSDNTRISVGGEEFITNTNDIVFIHNYMPHAILGAHKKYFLIIPPYYANDLDKSLSKKTLRPHLGDKEFNRTLLPILEKLHQSTDMPSLVKKGYLDILIGSLLAHYPTMPTKNPADLDFVLSILSYIEEHSAEPIDLATISDHFGYNKYYFSRLFNRTVGTNLTSYISFVRLRTFMRLYKEHKREKISKLASLAGFDSLPTFYRTFANVYGTSPKEYFAK